MTFLEVNSWTSNFQDYCKKCKIINKKHTYKYNVLEFKYPRHVKLLIFSCMKKNITDKYLIREME